MSRWCPRVGVYRATTCDPTRLAAPSASGLCLVLSWLGVLIEVTLARHDRSVFKAERKALRQQHHGEGQ